MPLLTIDYFSKILRKAMAMNVLLPANPPAGGKCPVFYILHGLSDNHTAWCRYTSLERHAARSPFIIVMPDAERSFYADGVAAPRHEAHIMEEVLPFIDQWFPTVATREGRFVGGLSMGGYGALKLALKHPGTFCAATSHSGCLVVGEVLTRYPDEPEIQRERRQIFGDAPQGGPEDIFALAEKLANAGGPLPELSIDCGVDDFLIEENRAFHQHLKVLGFPHVYTEHPGAHTWEYWDTHIPEAIDFQARVFSGSVNKGR